MCMCVMCVCVCEQEQVREIIAERRRALEAAAAGGGGAGGRLDSDLLGLMLRAAADNGPSCEISTGTPPAGRIRVRY